MSFYFKACNSFAHTVYNRPFETLSLGASSDILECWLHTINVTNKKTGDAVICFYIHKL